MWEIILDCFVDTLKVFPFLFLIYVLIELLEHRTTLTQNKKILQGELAPLIGSATGIIPQCGFSVMAAKLYDKGFIRTEPRGNDYALNLCKAHNRRCGRVFCQLYFKARKACRYRYDGGHTLAVSVPRARREIGFEN